MLTCYYCDLPAQALPFLKAAFTQLMGEGSVELKEVAPSDLRVMSHQASLDNTVLYMAVSAEHRKSLDDDFLNSPKYLEYAGISSFRDLLSETLGATLELSEEVESAESYNFTLNVYQNQIRDLEAKLSELVLEEPVPEGQQILTGFTEKPLIPKMKVGDSSWFFSGDFSSTKLAYSVMVSTALEEAQKGNKVLLIDLNPDSIIDYVLGSFRYTSGLEWLFSESVLSPSPTSRPGVYLLWNNFKVYNEAALLEVDWERKFSQLSDYKVFVYGGNLSSFFGKLLFYSGVFKAKPVVCSQGLVTSLRCLLVNLAYCSVSGFDVVVGKLNPSASKLLEALKQQCTVYTEKSYIGRGNG